MLDNIQDRNKALSFDAATAALQGARAAQEDSLVANFPLGQGSGYGIIADGMGGHAAGKVASDIVAATVFSHLKNRETELDSGVLNIPGSLRDAAHTANRNVKARMEKDPDTTGMGSTLLAVVVRQNRLSWMSIGDSILYLFRGGALRKLNKDHSLSPQIDMMVKAGSMDEKEARDHPDRNTLTSVVAGDEIAAIDCPNSALSLQPDDIIIAASDGLDYIEVNDLARILMSHTQGTSYEIAMEIVDKLESNDNPDKDNASLIIIKMNKPLERNDVMELDDLPVLVVADAGGAAPAPAPAAVQAPPASAAAPVEAAKEEKKAYWYRGRKYFKD